MIRKTHLEVRTVSSYLAQYQDRIDDLRKTITVMHAGTLTLRKAATAALPWSDPAEVEAFARRGDMTVLRLKLTGVPFKDAKPFATNSLIAFLDKNLIAFEYSWPSAQ